MIVWYFPLPHETSLISLDWKSVLRACNEQQGACLSHPMPVRLSALSSFCSWIKASLSDEIKLLIISFHKDSWEPALLHSIIILLIVFHCKLLHRTQMWLSVVIQRYSMSIRRRKSESVWYVDQASCVTAEKDPSKREITDRDQV